MTVRELVDALSKLPDHLDIYYPRDGDHSALVATVRTAERHVVSWLNPYWNATNSTDYIDEDPKPYMQDGDNLTSSQTVVMLGESESAT